MKKNRIVKITTYVNYTAIFRNPISDLKSILPTEYNECGKAKNYGDNTFGGVFPKGDATHWGIETGGLDGKCRE